MTIETNTLIPLEDKIPECWSIGPKIPDPIIAEFDPSVVAIQVVPNVQRNGDSAHRLVEITKAAHGEDVIFCAFADSKSEDGFFVGPIRLADLLKPLPWLLAKNAAAVIDNKQNDRTAELTANAFFAKTAHQMHRR